MGVTSKTIAMAGLVVLTATVTADADGPTTAPVLVDNPQYAAWARCRVGTSVTMVSDTDAGAAGQIHLEVTQVLKSVTADAVTLAHANKLTVGGKPQPGGPVTTQTIAAKVRPAEMKPIGNADVSAMGRSFTCHVYEAAQPGGRGAPPVTAYLNDGVAGGVVKLVVPMGKGMALTFVLTAADAK